MIFLCFSGSEFILINSSFSVLSTLPCILNETIINGISKQTRLGNINLATMLNAVICPPIHNIVVVTSPIGDQAPPAFAAIITIPVKYSLSLSSFINFLNKETITMVVVRLSKMADRKECQKADNPNQRFLFCLSYYFGNNIKTIMRINEFHYCHSA